MARSSLTLRPMVYQVRFHGRGGQGVRLASRIVSRAAFLAGFTVQDFPLYGAERRGAPVAAFVRLDCQPIGERGYIARPDALALFDESLLDDPDAGVLEGVGGGTLIVANSRRAGEELQRRCGSDAPAVAHDCTALALAELGQALLSAPMAGLVLRATGIAPWPLAAGALRVELAEIDAAADVVERNTAAMRRAFHAAPVVGRAAASPPAPPPAAGAPFVLPRLPARLAAPAITAGPTSQRRDTAGWRVVRPVIDRARCTRCLLCFALCPEGAIRLDGERYPAVDYQHCKGCAICVAECPPRAIAEVPEHAP
ncbi:2-oxoacid:acceptor oxidoreductase family protein [bacterium]|nr:2-oxoacid:acceptor oxidoreductase family protein [bacterium]